LRDLSVSFSSFSSSNGLGCEGGENKFAVRLRQITRRTTLDQKTEMIVATEKPSTLLIFDNATIILEMGRGGKIYAKASGWEANRTILEAQKIEAGRTRAAGSWRGPRRAVKSAPAIEPATYEDDL
jgi:hypothetical protein